MFSSIYYPCKVLFDLFTYTRFFKCVYLCVDIHTICALSFQHNLTRQRAEQYQVTQSRTSLTFSSISHQLFSTTNASQSLTHSCSFTLPSSIYLPSCNKSHLTFCSFFLTCLLFPAHFPHPLPSLLSQHLIYTFLSWV